MSGYLQRLVQTAAQPVQSVHPFVGSIFASSYDDQQRSVESEEFGVATSAINRPAGPTLQPQTVPRHNAQPEGVPLREYRPIAPADTVTPLQTGGETNADARQIESSRALLLQEEQFVQPPRPASNFEETEPDYLPSSVTLRTEFHPLMPQEAAVAAPQLAHPTSRAKGRAPSDSRSVAAGRASDDIEIHIGRIEVTAVHPPAPRTSKTPDRSPSLDAYLNRRAR
jgi:hypothetical protein